MDALNSVSWANLCTPNELAFRAACNSVVDHSLRPVKRRVIERLSNSPEAQDLFKKFWSAAVVPSTSFPAENFFTLLVKDPLWQTIVSEEVDNEHSWKDLFNGNFFKEGAKVKDWFRSFLEKLGGKDHPAARALTAATLGLSLVVGVKYEKPDMLTIPVTVAPSYDSKGDRITFKVDTDPVKVSLTASATSADIPVQLRLLPDEKPVRINFVSDGQLKGNLTDGLVEITKKLGATNASLKQAASNLKLIATQPVHADLVGLSKTLAGVEQNISATTLQLTETNSKLADLKSTYETQSENEASNSQNAVQNINQRLGILTKASARRQDATRLILEEGTVRSLVVLPYLDPASGQETSRDIRISVVSIGGNDKDKTVSLTITPKNEEPVAYKEGDNLSLLPVPWTLTVNSIQKHWYGRNSVTLTFTPESSVFPSPDSVSSKQVPSDITQPKRVPPKMADNRN
jgi:hypothetical protein